jgi:hypothetical protein
VPHLRQRPSLAISLNFLSTIFPPCSPAEVLRVGSPTAILSGQSLTVWRYPNYPRAPRPHGILGSGPRVNARAADRVRRARRATIDAVAASWTIGSEDDGPREHRPARQVSLPDLRQPADVAARPRERAPKAERGAGSAAAVPLSGAALDLIRLNSATRRRRRQAQAQAQALGANRRTTLDHAAVSNTIRIAGLFVPKPSHGADCQRCRTPDLGTTVRQHPLASAVVGGDCYSLGYSVHVEPLPVVSVQGGRGGEREDCVYLGFGEAGP